MKCLRLDLEVVPSPKEKRTKNESPDPDQPREGALGLAPDPAGDTLGLVLDLADAAPPLGTAGADPRLPLGLPAEGSPGGNATGRRELPDPLHREGVVGTLLSPPRGSGSGPTMGTAPTGTGGTGGDRRRFGFNSHSF